MIKVTVMLMKAMNQVDALILSLEGKEKELVVGFAYLTAQL